MITRTFSTDRCCCSSILSSRRNKAKRNYRTKIWEDIYDDSGSGEINGGQGWSMFETHYHNVGETCKQTPWMESDDISLNGSHVNTTETQFFNWGDGLAARTPFRSSQNHRCDKNEKVQSN